MARDEDRRGSFTADGPGGPDLSGILADLSLAIGQMRDQAAKPASPMIPWEAVHPVPILGNITLTAGAGTTNQANNLYGPNDPYHWDLRRLSAWGFTAGTVTVYLNDTNGEQLAVFPSAGQNTWSSQAILTPRDRLIFVAASVTGTVTFGGQAIEVHSEWLPAYLM